MGTIRRFVSVVAPLILATGLIVGVSPGANAATCSVRNADTGTRYAGAGANLQEAIDVASSGDTLTIKGVCVVEPDLGRRGFTLAAGTTVDALTLVGIASERFGTPTLSGGGWARVLSLHGVRLAVRDLVITDGRSPGVGDGGGILARGADLTLTGTTLVTRNLAGEGGGVAVEDGSLVIEGSASITKNRASAGAGIVLEKASVVLNDSASVARNRARSWGGGIYGRRGMLVMNHSASILGNVSRHAAGGVASYRSLIVMNDAATVARNRSTDIVGGVHVGWQSTLRMNGSARVLRNEARKAGGVGMWEARKLVLNDSASVTENVARRVGGGVFTHLSPVYVCSDLAAISPNDPDDPPVTLPCT